MLAAMSRSDAMPYDLRQTRRTPPGALREGVLDCVSRAAGNAALSDDDIRAELRLLLGCAQDPAGELWDKYRGGRPEAVGRVYAKYGY
jgi:hypothetical protein